jgi:O-antigen/teichoic acid export membrane protein
VASRIVGVLAVFAFVTEPTEIKYIFLAQGVPQVLFGVLFVSVVFSRNSYSFRGVCISSLKTCLADSYGTFISRALVSVYSNLIPIMVGVLAGKEQLAVFSVADKIRLVVQAIASPILDLEFARNDRNSSFSGWALVRSSLHTIAVVFGVCAFIFFMAPPIVELVAGSAYHESVTPLRVLVFIPFILVFTFTLGLNGLYKNGDKRSVNHAFAFGALIGVSIAPFLILRGGAIGAAFAVLLAELVVLSVVIAKQKMGRG